MLTMSSEVPNSRRVTPTGDNFGSDISDMCNCIRSDPRPVCGMGLALVYAFLAYAPLAQCVDLSWVVLVKSCANGRYCYLRACSTPFYQ